MCCVPSEVVVRLLASSRASTPTTPSSLRYTATSSHARRVHSVSLSSHAAYLTPWHDCKHTFHIPCSISRYFREIFPPLPLLPLREFLATPTHREASIRNINTCRLHQHQPRQDLVRRAILQQDQQALSSILYR